MALRSSPDPATHLALAAALALQRVTQALQQAPRTATLASGHAGGSIAVLLQKGQKSNQAAWGPRVRVKAVHISKATMRCDMEALG